VKLLIVLFCVISSGLIIFPVVTVAVIILGLEGDAGAEGDMGLEGDAVLEGDMGLEGDAVLEGDMGLEGEAVIEEDGDNTDTFIAIVIYNIDK